ncbi:hypothetical protein SAMN05444920_103434 [Nonomuraea solani]|uniref:Uncharacterized protein n=1 Tax=Nonomuraea solani TaxID=1144553 RepID=A0A1H6BK91_9ACTN|nr:hypothetical protein SAMN05444920_103434 [Nonomuraea solani]
MPSGGFGQLITGQPRVFTHFAKQTGKRQPGLLGARRG